eukprot:gnl/Chilomastix_cuspidata/3713.p2 GENE.gnl/Chilomastix_cuspidata/3713~~gnl/Chilomastix_cuspidata/3713.p2  ORF type:complete len:575 (+),score=267.40 gnl/Chilomastix_cuspidata/3713:194-1918(+)
METPTKLQYLASISEYVKEMFAESDIPLSKLFRYFKKGMQGLLKQPRSFVPKGFLQENGSWKCPVSSEHLAQCIFFSRLAGAMYGERVLRFYDSLDEFKVTDLRSASISILYEASATLLTSPTKNVEELIGAVEPDASTQTRGGLLDVASKFRSGMETSVRACVEKQCGLPAACVRWVSVPTAGLDPLWALLEMSPEQTRGDLARRTVALAVRGSWSAGDWIGDTHVVPTQVFFPPLPPLHVLGFVDSPVDRFLPERFRALDRARVPAVRKAIARAFAESESRFAWRPDVVLRGMRRELAPDAEFADDPRAVEGFFAHRGFLLMASNIYYSALPFLAELVTPGTDLVVCGHSLGAGVAQVLAFFLRQRFPQTQCFAYAPPATVPRAAAAAMRPYVTSVVFNEDIVPRLSAFAGGNLAKRLHMRHRWEEAEREIARSSAPVTPRILDEAPADVFSARQLGYALDPDGPLCLFPGGTLLHIVFRDPGVKTSAQLLAARGVKSMKCLWHPGRPHRSEYLLLEPADLGNLDEVLLGPHVLLNHRPSEYTVALEALWQTQFGSPRRARYTPPESPMDTH